MDWEIPLTEYFQTEAGKNAGNHAGQQNRNKCCAGGYLRCYFKLRFVKFHSVIRPSQSAAFVSCGRKNRFFGWCGQYSLCPGGEGLGKSFINCCGIKEILQGGIIYFIVSLLVLNIKGLLLAAATMITSFATVKFLPGRWEERPEIYWGQCVS